MQDLRLVGVHDDGGHLLLSGTGGEMFRLPIDEALRVAASRTPAQVAARSTAAPVAMSPRDIQSRIRSGASAAQIAEISGLPLANIQRYEGPVLAERDYVAQQARKVEVASPAPGHDIYRSAFGDNPATLDQMVAYRLTAHGIDSSSVEWDSWRRTDGSWTVVARFEANPAAPTTIGEEPPAMWTFSPARKSLQNANRWAQQLSELEPLDGPVPTRRLSAVADRPFDFEADSEAASVPPPVAPAKDADGLLDMLRSRRGQRLGVDEDGDDALAALLTSGVPAAHPRPAEVPGIEPTEAEPVESEALEPTALALLRDERRDDEGPRAAGQEQEGRTAEDRTVEDGGIDGRGLRRRDGRPTILSRISLAPRPESIQNDPLRLHGGVSTDTREITMIPGPLRPITALHHGTSGRPAEADKPPEAPHAPNSDDEEADVLPGEAEGQHHSARSTRKPETQRAGLDELLGGARSALAPTGPASLPVATNVSGRRNTEVESGNGTPRKETPEAERQPGRAKRSSVPSWDEIVFGARGD
ncbi:septation protein SepH [Arthrobacter sp. ISL-30]|uniref:septation protein SepH n=1 Tax=Arthrobacter sp. ISL-30 TaxID=2819109 RepID=UPI001BE5E7F8|nr:septation protein SepH [Arthrobacter sp. ISL-30]MBT2512131.1 DUF3071 domain-containing protein [Arthrobacter sp. ISL-30]